MIPLHIAWIVFVTGYVDSVFKVEPTFTPPTKRLVKDPVAPVSTPEQLRLARVLVPTAWNCPPTVVLPVVLMLVKLPLVPVKPAVQ